MKIASIDIKEFRQFKNLTLDLTYPKGHEKAGEPLDKVCIIGQSGTGKTNLLNLIYLKQLITKKKNTSLYEEYRSEVHNTKIGFKEDNSSLNKFLFNTSFIYLPVKSTLKNLNFLEDNEEKSKRLWKIKSDYKYKNYANKRSELVFAISNALGKRHQNEIEELIRQRDKWEELNSNPLEELANFFNPIIQKFGLKTREDITNLDQLEFISLIDKDGREVPQSQWSTGTNQIIFKIYPLFDKKPENAIILIDEPENSLYPDIQTEIIEHYTRLAPTSQFFFATHSPIIASCFEPWEIVELKFNEDKEVYRDLYYEGENHVDNYNVDPRYLSYNSILLKIFDLKGNINPFRHKQLTELAKVDDKLQRLKQNGKSPENVEKIKTLIKEYNALAEKLDWEIN